MSLLRRIASELRQHHWTGVFIELAIVVFGVLIGMQVSNWNDDRIDRGLAHADLSQVSVDLRTQTDYQKTTEDSAKQRIAAVDYIYREAFGTRLPTTLRLSTETWQAPAVPPYPADRLDNLLGAVNLVRVSTRSRNAYDSLISSGRLAQLQNRPLVRQMQTYYGNYEDMLSASNMIRSFRNDGARDQYPLGVSVWDERPAAEIVALARSNPGFAAYLRSQREWAILQYNLLQNIGKETAALQIAVDKELAKQ